MPTRNDVMNALSIPNMILVNNIGQGKKTIKQKQTEETNCMNSLSNILFLHCGGCGEVVG